MAESSRNETAVADNLERVDYALLSAKNAIRHPTASRGSSRPELFGAGGPQYVLSHLRDRA